jgi:ABC-type lipoprotein export system ATPase subunit
MKNVVMKVERGKLTILVDLEKDLGPSASGKSTIIATTEGNVDVPEAPDVKIGLNVYRKKERFK